MIEIERPRVEIVEILIRWQLGGPAGERIWYNTGQCPASYLIVFSSRCYHHFVKIEE